MVVTARDAPSDCAAAVIDRQVSSRHGAMTLRRIGEGFEITPTRPAGYDRPWARAAPHAGPVPEVRPQRDATPRADDLEAGD
jgi:competence protein ComEC